MSRPGLFCALLCALSTFGADYFPPPDSAGGWRKLTDADQIRSLAGMDLKRLDAAFEVCNHSTQNGGLLVVRHGYLVYEKYFGRAHRNANPDMASTGKAFTSIACGIMLHEKRDALPDGLDTKVFTEKYLSEAFPLDDPRKADITLGQLLCMTAGFHGEGTSPAVINGVVEPLKPVPGQDIRNLDMSSIRTVLWNKPGAGYSYSSPAPHIASIVLRHVTGMELQDYINEKLAKPMGWGAWGYCLQRGDFHMPHANGAGSTALHATDALRFAYCLLHKGRWGEQQLVPADYVALCGQTSKYDPHAPFTLQFEINADGHVVAAPGDAFWKNGAGAFSLYIVPSLDMVIYKLGGSDNAYKPELTGIPQPFNYDGSRDTWKPGQGPFGASAGADSVNRVLELVSLAVIERVPRENGTPFTRADLSANASRPISIIGVTTSMPEATIPITSREHLPLEQFPWGTLQWLCNAALFNGAQQTLGTCELSPGQHSPLHYHPNCEEILTVLSGTGRHSYDGDSVKMIAGATIHIPAGVRHNLTNTGAEPLKCLIAFSTGQRETIFLETM